MGKKSDFEQIKRMQHARQMAEHGAMFELAGRDCPGCGLPIVRKSIGFRKPMIYFGEPFCAKCCDNFIEQAKANQSALNR